MIKFIMLPFAGSLGYAYQQWAELAVSSNYMDIVMVDYNGRGNRYQYKQAETWQELIAETYKQITPIIHNNEDYILFGHSMGAKVVYELYYQIANHDMNLPKCIIFSGCKVPDSPMERLLEMPEQEFRERFINIGGIDRHILKDKEFTETVFKTLREDIALLDQYKFDITNEKIQCPVIVLNGRKDAISEVDEWNKLLARECFYIMFEDGHFFIFSQKHKVINTIQQIIFHRL